MVDITGPVRVIRAVRFPLRVKLWLFASLLLMAHLVAVGWVALRLTRASVETSQRELQIAVIENVASRIGYEFANAQDALELLGRTLTDDTLDEDARLSLASALIASNEGLDNAVVFASDGTLITPIVEEGTKALDTPTTLPEALRSVAIEKGLASADPVLAFDGPRVLVVVPMRAQEEVTGFAAALLSMAAIQDAVRTEAEAHFSDPRTALFVVDRSRHYVAHGDPEASASLQSAAHEPALAGVDVGALSGLMSKAAEFEATDGTTLVGTIVGLPQRGWTVVAQVPHDIVYGPVLALRRVIWVAVGIAVLVALVSSIVLARQLTSPLAQLSQFAEALSRRDFDTKITVETSDELALLGDVMAKAAQDLQSSEKKILAEEAIRADLRRYLPGELVDKVVSRKQNMALGGERRDVTVMFADVVSFTMLTQKLQPEEIVEILNDLFTIITEIVFRHGGTVDKFIGDCVMAMWGAPGEMEHHAAAALEAAEEIKSWLEAGNAHWQDRFGIKVEVAVGINSGAAVVGNVGSTTRMEYTAIGETVNIAARLEAIARPMQILVSDETRRLAGDGFTFVPAGERSLAGREQPITLWEVVS